MKKILFLVTALLAMVQQSSAETDPVPVITVADVEAVPGETVAFSLNLTGGKADLYKSLQFDVQFPATGFSTIVGGYTVSPLWLSVSCTVGDVDATGLATIPFASSEAIPAANVEDLVSVSFKVANTVGTGEYEVTLKNIFLGYNTSDKDYPADVTFKVKVVERHTVVLDETSTTAPANATGVDVTVKRTINANEWSTICLPFNMTQAQCEAAFGEDVHIMDFTGCNVTMNGNDVTGITVNFTDATAIDANHPYIIKVSDKVTDFTVDNVTITVANEPDVERDENIINIPGVYSITLYNRFIGTYVAQTEIAENKLFLSDNKFWYSNGSTKMKAFRGYFDFYNILTNKDTSGSRVMLSFDDETTGIGYNKRETTNNNQWYTLDGRKLDKKPTAKGVYVKEGRKVVIK